MDPARVRDRARELGLRGQVVPIPGGWGSDTFEVDGSWIFRVARTAEVAASHHREARLLPSLARCVPFDVPVPEHVGEVAGRTFMAYRKLPGRELTGRDRWAQLAPMLRRLHDFPADRARALLGCAGDPREWYEVYAAQRGELARLAFPRLDPELRRRANACYDAFLTAATDFVPVLVHGDLGTEHVLVDPATGEPTGLIDFEDAAVGDPAIDFVGVLCSLGPAATRELIHRYGRPVSWERLRFYWWVGSAEAIAHGVRTGDEQIVRDGVAGVRDRLGVR